jgi:glycosyltransferase involved in cell wall biosynthesis
MSAIRGIAPPFSVAESEQIARVSAARRRMRLGANPADPTPVLSVVVPVYNEVATVEIILQRLKELPFTKEIIVVDDCSTDGTVDRLAAYACDPEIVVLYHPENRGKGAGLKTGYAYATGRVLAVQDADLEYDPADLVALVLPILDDEADVVYGSRLCAGDHDRQFMAHHLLANRFLSALARVLFRTSLSDIHTCYKVMRREVMEGVEIRSNDFKADSEITAKILRADWRVQERPISYRARSHGEGKKITWRDGMPSLFALFRYRFAD